MSTARQATNTMTIERLRGFFDACNDHDIDRMVDYFTTDGSYLGSAGPNDDGTPFRGIDEVRRGFTAFLDAYPDGHYNDIRLYVDEERGIAQWTFSGSGIRYRGVDIFQFSGGQIALKDAFRKERSEPIGASGS
jgi:hypothetical protein